MLSGATCFFFSFFPPFLATVVSSSHCSFIVVLHRQKGRPFSKRDGTRQSRYSVQAVMEKSNQEWLKLREL